MQEMKERRKSLQNLIAARKATRKDEEKIKKLMPAEKAINSSSRC